MPIRPLVRRLAAALLFSMGLAASAQQKTINDPVEYKAYTDALGQQEPAAEAEAMESFVARYPGSVMVADALEQAMAAWQRAGKAQEVERLARRVHGLAPENPRALAIIVYLDRTRATQGDAGSLAEMEAFAKAGQQALDPWRKPDGMTDSEFSQLRRQMEAIFQGALGFASLQRKDYPAARSAYLKAIDVGGDDLQADYQLAVADLELKPLDPDGFWYAAKAIAFAKASGNAHAEESIRRYGSAKYVRYHGCDCSFEELVARAAKTDRPPAGFAATIPPAPASEAGFAALAAMECPFSDLSVGDWETILRHRGDTPANQAAADKVWAGILALQGGKSGKIRWVAKVAASRLDALEASVAAEPLKAGAPDVRIRLAKPAAKAPTVGSWVTATGTLTGYTAEPFAFEMSEAAVEPAEAPAP